MTLENHEKAYPLFDKVSIDIKENENLDYKSEFKNSFKGECFTKLSEFDRTFQNDANIILGQWHLINFDSL